MKILNAFSINMLEGYAQVQFTPLTEEHARSLVRAAQYRRETIDNCIGHADLANIVSWDLGVGGGVRKTTTLVGGDRAIVAQYTGPRLPEESFHLPEGAVIKYWLVAL